MNVISFRAYIAPEFYLDRMTMGKVSTIGLAGTLVGGFRSAIGGRAKGRPCREIV